MVRSDDPARKMGDMTTKAKLEAERSFAQTPDTQDRSFRDGDLPFGRAEGHSTAWRRGAAVFLDEGNGR